MVELQDEPIADPVCVPVHYVAKLARDNGVVVAQLGEGADELFFGYPCWRTLLDLQRADDLPVPRRAEARRRRRLAPRSAGPRREVEYLRRGGLGQPIFWSGAESFMEAEKQRLLAAGLQAARSATSPPGTRSSRSTSFRANAAPSSRT